MNSVNLIVLAACASLSRICPNCSFLYFLSLSMLAYRYYYTKHRHILMAGFFFSYALFTLHWIYIPFTFDDATKVFAPLAVFILPTYISSYYFGFEKLFGKLRCHDDSIYTCLRFTLVIALSEICCTNLFTGFPWMNSGYAWATDLVILQVTSVIGINALGTTMTLCAAVVGLALHEYDKTRHVDYRKLAFVSIIIAAIFAFGSYRLYSSQTTYTDTTVRIVQASIDQTTKNSPQNYDKIFKINESLSIQEPKVDLIIWPEACIPWLYSSFSGPVINRYLEYVTQKCKYLISGVITKTPENHYYNSVVAFSNNGIENTAKVVYNKRHLLPFGEYMPLRRFVGIKSIASVISDFSFGDGTNMSLDEVPSFQTCVCYESIFESEFEREKDTKWILNITNDGWYKTSNENFQHNNISRVLSVEYGLPMVRVNNLGISAVFDAYGRCVNSIPSKKVGALDLKIPECIKATNYSKNKNFVYTLLVVLLYLICIKRIFYCN